MDKVIALIAAISPLVLALVPLLVRMYQLRSVQVAEEKQRAWQQLVMEAVMAADELSRAAQRSQLPVTSAEKRAIARSYIRAEAPSRKLEPGDDESIDRRIHAVLPQVRPALPPIRRPVDPHETTPISFPPPQAIR